jgi:16S rRNA (adenine(1408)-N(1))-methyltransferase
MRILNGTKVVEAPADWADGLRNDGRGIVADVGAGDGRFVYESARHHPASIYVAIDPDADTLAEYAFRAGRKPARGGVENAHFVVAPVQQLPAELAGLADVVCVNFPWGSLLRGVLEPQADVLQALASLTRRGGDFELVLSYDPEHDPNAFTGSTLPALDETYIAETLTPAYEAAGLLVRESRRLTQDEALAIPSSWGRRLLHARPRPVFRIAGGVR